MLKYKYSPREDFKIFLHNRRKREFLRSEGIVVFSWNFFEYLKFLFRYFFGKIELPEVETKKDVVCYLVSSGTWGAYELPNRIYICPRELGKLNQSLSDLIRHEMMHLEYEDEVKNMSYSEKEKFVNEKA